MTNELKMRLSALGKHDAEQRAANSRLVLAMQQDFECGAFSSTCGDAEVVNSDVDSGTTGDDSSMLSIFVANTTESAKPAEIEDEIDQDLQLMDKQEIDEAWNDLHTLRSHAMIDWQLYIHALNEPSDEQMEMQALFLTLIMNPFSLTDEE